VILLDTNICIHVINARPPAVLERLRHYRMGVIGVCSVVAAELAYGVAAANAQVAALRSLGLQARFRTDGCVENLVRQIPAGGVDEEE
jgi:predicted nucleic acid-binding protein